MKRTINHTEKKRIPKNNVDISTIKKDDKIDRFRADINLDDLGLPGDAKVFVEAYRRFQWNRYDFGTVDSLGARERLDLGDLAYSESLSFRVFAKDESGKILGVADDIAPTEEEVVTPLLPVEKASIGQEIWNVEYTGTNGGPVLLLNEEIPDILERARSDFQFILSVYPEVLRKILARIIYVEQNVERIDNLSESWQRDWVKLAKNIYPEKNPPTVIDPSDSEFRPGEMEAWLDDVRREFAAKRNREWRNYIDWIESGDVI